MNVIRRCKTMWINVLKYQINTSQKKQKLNLKASYNILFDGFLLYECKQKLRLGMILYLSFFGFFFSLAVYLQNQNQMKLTEQMLILSQITAFAVFFVLCYRNILRTVKRIVLNRDGATVKVSFYKRGCLGENNYLINVSRFQEIKATRFHRQLVINSSDPKKPKSFIFYLKGVKLPEAFHQVAHGRQIHIEEL